MNKSRLIEVLKSLSKWEMQRLEKYLASPYHNTRADVIALYEHIAFALRENLEAALDKKYTYEKLFPNRTLSGFLPLRNIDKTTRQSAFTSHALTADANSPSLFVKPLKQLMPNNKKSPRTAPPNSFAAQLYKK